MNSFSEWLKEANMNKGKESREMMYDEVATGTIIDRFPKVMSMEISNLIGVLKSEGLDNTEIGYKVLEKFSVRMAVQENLLDLDDELEPSHVELLEKSIESTTRNIEDVCRAMGDKSLDTSFGGRFIHNESQRRDAMEKWLDTERYILARRSLDHERKPRAKRARYELCRTKRVKIDDTDITVLETESEDSDCADRDICVDK